MTDEERNAPENLMILCPNHHREIDSLRPQHFSAEDLMRMKVNHESACENKNWASDAVLDFAAASVLASPGSSTVGQAEVALETRLIIQEGRGDTFEVANIGEQDAFNVMVEAIGGGKSVLRLEEDAARDGYRRAQLGVPGCTHGPWVAAVTLPY